jgi:hypothetical protein
MVPNTRNGKIYAHGIRNLLGLILNFGQPEYFFEGIQAVKQCVFSIRPFAETIHDFHALFQYYRLSNNFLVWAPMRNAERK